MSQPDRGAGGRHAESASRSIRRRDRQVRHERGGGERDEQPERAERAADRCCRHVTHAIAAGAFPPAAAWAGAPAPCTRAAAPRGRPWSTVQDGSTIGPSVSTSSVSWRPLCRSRTTSRTPRIEPSGRRGPVRSRCDSSSSSTLPSRRTRPLAQQDDVVADPLDVRDRRATRSRRSPESRRRRPSAAAGTHGRRAGRGSRTARRAARAAAACRGPARAPAGLARRPRARRPSSRESIRVSNSTAISSSQREFVRRAYSIVSATREGAVERRALCDVADLGEHVRGLRVGRGRARSIEPSVGASMPAREGEQRRLARGVRACQADDRALRDRQRAVAERPFAAKALAQPVRRRAAERSCHASGERLPKRGGDRARGCSPRRALRAEPTSSQSSSSRAQLVVVLKRRGRERARR